MTPWKRKKRLSARRRPRSASSDPATLLTAEQLEALWAAYRADRGDLRLRNRLVEHYLPFVRHFAAAIAKRMHLRDRPNAVGDVLAMLVADMVPQYDGQSGFERYARVCTRRKLIDHRREERRDRSVIVDVPAGPSGSAVFERIPQPEPVIGEGQFAALTAGLDEQQAAVLRLRFGQGLDVRAVAAALHTSAPSVKRRTRAALAKLKKNWNS